MSETSTTRKHKKGLNSNANKSSQERKNGAISADVKQSSSDITTIGERVKQTTKDGELLGGHIRRDCSCGRHFLYRFSRTISRPAVQT